MDGTITNNEIKLIRSLERKKFRDSTGLFVVEGEKMVEEAVNSSFEVERIYRKDEIGEKAMERISLLSSPSPVLALVKKPDYIRLKTEKEIDGAVGDRGLYLFLDSIRDPGNLGTIIRIADWFGIDAVFASEDTVDIFNPKVVQATMGAVFRMKFHYAGLDAVSGTFLARRGRIFGTLLDGEDIYGYPLATGDNIPVGIVIGNESEGISPMMRKLLTDRIFIPSYPGNEIRSESLNAAVATAVAVAEFRRRTYMTK